MDAFCILFADSYEKIEMNELAGNRTLASVPFGARYRLVDYILSSLVNGNVNNIGIVTRNKYGSLMDHVGWGKDWDLNRKNSGIKFLTPFIHDTSSALISNRIEALNSVLEFIKTSLGEYCILSDANIVMNIDFKKFMNFHEEKGADITVAYKKMKPDINELEITLDENSRVCDTLFHQYGQDEVKNVELNIVMLKKDLLISLIEKGMTYGWYSLKKNVIAHGFSDYKIFAYEIEGYTSVIKSAQDFYVSNMHLLNKDVRMGLFHGKGQILTRIKDSVPTMYGENSVVKNSLIADGSEIDGEVDSCVLFRDVIIKKGAKIKNSILMQGVVVESNTTLDHVIADKDVIISGDKNLSGSSKFPFIITKGKMV